MTEKPYERWLAERREVSVPVTLTDHIMSQVANLERQRRDTWWLRSIWWIDCSRPARWAVCGGAFVVGSSPFVFLAHVAQLVKF
jgi:hypothetical protein